MQTVYIFHAVMMDIVVQTQVHFKFEMYLETLPIDNFPVAFYRKFLYGWHKDWINCMVGICYTETEAFNILLAECGL